MARRQVDLDKLKMVLEYLVKDMQLPEKYRNYNLTGDYTNHQECHIEPDWLLIYRREGQELYLERTGTHSDLF